MTKTIKPSNPFRERKNNYTKVPSEILGRSDLSNSAFRLFVYFCGWGDEIFVGYDRIASETGMSLGTVTKSIKELEQRGMLKVIRSKKHPGNPVSASNRYHLQESSNWNVALKIRARKQPSRSKNQSDSLQNLERDSLQNLEGTKEDLLKKNYSGALEALEEPSERTNNSKEQENPPLEASGSNIHPTNLTQEETTQENPAALKNRATASISEGTSIPELKVLPGPECTCSVGRKTEEWGNHYPECEYFKFRFPIKKRFERNPGLRRGSVNR